MQTFIPYASYDLSAAVLDNKRLGKQRVETLQILQVLIGERLITSTIAVNTRARIIRTPLPRESWSREPLTTAGWRNHPAVLMWRGHELSLLAYQQACCSEWTARGFKDTCLAKSEYLLAPHRESLNDTPPSFIGDEEVHLSHKSNLLRKDEAYYRTWWPSVPADLPYKWPK